MQLWLFPIEHFRLFFILYSDITRKGKIFSSAFSSRAPSVALLTVYVFAAMHSIEGASSFTLEMKELQWDEGVEVCGSALLLVDPTEPFCIFSLCSSRHRLSPYLRVEFNLFLQFFILPTLFLSLPPSFRFSPSVNARFLLFIRASSKLLSEWLRRVVTRLTHVHSFLFFALISQFLRESRWISIIINLTIRRAIFPSFHRAVIKWMLLIVPDTKDRILEVYLFLSGE